jgi:hypothetical protein
MQYAMPFWIVMKVFVMTGKYVEDEYLEEDAKTVQLSHIIADFNAGKQILVVAEETSTFVKNYGYFTQYKNKADGMAWDCVIVGQKGDVPIDKPYEVANIFGVLSQPDGNDKIMVGIKENHMRNLVAPQIAGFAGYYRTISKSHSMQFHPLSDGRYV